MEKSDCRCQLISSRNCLGHERRVFKAIYGFSAPGWSTWSSAVAEPDFYSGTHEILVWIIQEDFFEFNFVISLNFRKKVLSKLLILRCQLFRSFSLSFSLLPQNSTSDIWRVIIFKALLSVFARYLLSP